MLNPTSTVDTQHYEFSTFSGADIKAVFHGHTIGTLQQISYRIQQAKSPVYTMGSKFPRGFGYGTMAVAGTLVFTMLDRHELLAAMREVAAKDPTMQPWLDKEDAKPSAFASKDVFPSIENSTNITRSLGITRVGAAGDPVLSGVFVGEDELQGTLTSDQVQDLPNYVTEILPFTITVVASNEFGRSSAMAIHGVNIITEGFQISIDHVTSDIAFEFIATSVTPWAPVER